MSEVYLRKKIKEISSSGSTLLWLEGARHETIVSARVTGNRLILETRDQLVKIVSFQRYTTTKVGLQFWSQGRPGVLYRWDQVPVEGAVAPQTTFPGHDDDPPPGMAA